jgi:hypothetical protein
MMQPLEAGALAGLVQAYRETEYHVASPEGSLTFRVGQENSNNDMLLIGAGVERWAVVTAWNPHSQQRSWEENDEAQDRLKKTIESQGFKWWEAAGTHPSNDWPAEESCLILNIAPHDARELCREFEQLAVLFGETGDAPWLLFGDWEQIGPALKSANSEHPQWQSLLAQTIERNDAL